MHIAERHVLHMTLTRIRFNPSSVTRVDSGDVFEEDVIDVFGDVCWVAHAANAHGAAFVASHILDVNVAAVAFDGYTVLDHPS